MVKISGTKPPDNVNQTDSGSNNEPQKHINFSWNETILKNLRRMETYPLRDAHIEGLKNQGMSIDFPVNEAQTNYEKIFKSELPYKAFDPQKTLPILLALVEVLKKNPSFATDANLYAVSKSIIAFSSSEGQFSDMETFENFYIKNNNPFSLLALVHIVAKLKAGVDNETPRQASVLKTLDQMLNLIFFKFKYDFSSIHSDQLIKDFNSRGFLEEGLIKLSQHETDKKTKEQLTKILKIVQDSESYSKHVNQADEFREEKSPYRQLTTSYSAHRQETFSINEELENQQLIREGLTQMYELASPRKLQGKLDDNCYDNPFSFLSSEFDKSGKKLLVLNNYENQYLDEPARYVDIILDLVENFAKENQIKEWGFGQFLDYFNFGMAFEKSSSEMDLNIDDFKKLVTDFFSKTQKENFKQFASIDYKYFKTDKDEMPPELQVFIHYMDKLKTLQNKYSATISIFNYPDEDENNEMDTWVKQNNQRKILIAPTEEDLEINKINRENYFGVKQRYFDYSEADLKEENPFIGDIFTNDRLLGFGVLYNLIQLGIFDPAGKTIDLKKGDSFIFPSTKELKEFSETFATDQACVYDNPLREELKAYDVNLITFLDGGNNDDNDGDDGDDGSDDAPKIEPSRTNFQTVNSM